MPAPDILILYASISGRTAKVVAQIRRQFFPFTAKALNLRDDVNSIARCKLMVFGSPTYGVGDWHYLWEKRSVSFRECNVAWPSQQVAIFALGDAKHHPNSFAGAIASLRDLVVHLNAQPVGEVPIDSTYDKRLCDPLLVNGYFPGLVIDQAQQRRIGSQQIQEWVWRLKQEISTNPKCNA